MNRSIPLSKALDDCIVAYRMNGEMLRPEQGYPVRLVVPGWEGNVWVKWLRRLKIGDQPWFTREETSKYTDLLESGKARKFTFVMDAKSVITSPSPQAPVKQKGFNVISGLAWSGRGKIRRVDVSLDGGRNWRTARIDGFVLEKACVRFYYEFDWNGEELLLSRAPWTRQATFSRARMPCAKFAASIRSTTTTGFRPGRSSRTARLRMSKSAEIALGAALVAALATSTMAQSKKESPRNYGIGHVAWRSRWPVDIDVQSDGYGGACGQRIRKAGEKYMDNAACHGDSAKCRALAAARAARYA
jgi:hypothetical protein